jgi:uncharacterized membrane protein
MKMDNDINLWTIGFFGVIVIISIVVFIYGYFRDKRKRKSNEEFWNKAEKEMELRKEKKL